MVGLWTGQERQRRPEDSSQTKKGEIKMDDVVRMIYDGDYAPADRLADKPPELREARERAYQSYAAFKKALTDEQLEAYEKMMEVQGEVAGLELREAFAVGARAGAQMLASLLFGE